MKDFRIFEIFWIFGMEVFGKDIFKRHNLFQSFPSIGRVDLVEAKSWQMQLFVAFSVFFKVLYINVCRLAIIVPKLRTEGRPWHQALRVAVIRAGWWWLQYCYQVQVDILWGSDHGLQQQRSVQSHHSPLSCSVNQRSYCKELKIISVWQFYI